MNIENKLGEVLRKYRKKMGFSQEELAFRCGLERVYISMIERGQRKPTVHTMFIICKELRIRPSAFFNEIEESLIDFKFED
ncbi:helix-turn-helix domain-containing protein [Sutcliffiella sp. NC1]|uniref:helix-turn-helix domain-containing protein n=1 Tax=Sutcliffiella sp. NC1 TaxID=3004096 RepID=UPI0022DE65D8|nr:helix-turn-helix transcriptional regulator [Sutcliffiella sp. NC1]WBL15114.1 helix-turn-helix transcriptional regulator [Sutcliffiella sp. NC1]